MYMNITTGHKKRDQLWTAGCRRQLESAIAAHRPGKQRSQQQYNDNFNNKFVISIVIVVMLLYYTLTTPQDFVCSWTAEATTYLFNNKQFPPTLTYEMCVMLLLLTKNKTRTINKGTIIKQNKEQLEPPMGGRSLGLLFYSIRRGFLRQRPASPMEVW